MSNVILEINGIEFSGWEALKISRSIDSIADAFSFSSMFDPIGERFTKNFKPYGLQRAIIKIDGEQILVGRLELLNIDSSESDTIINVQGRSATGVLVDSCIDNIGYTFSGLTLKQIVEKQCAPFGLGVINQVPDIVIKEAVAQVGDTAFSFINALAQDVGLLLTNDNNTNVVIKKIDATQSPIDDIIEGQSSLLKISASYDATKRFSQYKVVQQQDGNNAISALSKDIAVPLYRPFVFVGSESDAKNIQKSSDWKRALGFANSFSLNITIAGWKNKQNKLWSPNTIVTVLAPSVFILKPFPFLIASCEYTLDVSQGEITTMTLVLPSTYTGEMPKDYPWA